MPSPTRVRPAHAFLIALAALIIVRTVTAQDEDMSAERETFTVADHKAFVLEPPQAARREGPMPWVWYAPTLGRHPGREENWMFKRFHKAGIAIAGIDVGESFGSPSGRAIYQHLYEELTTNRGFGKQPVLLARSRGGLMLYNWAVEHPESVGGVAGIYPVCNLTSYPGVQRSAGAYAMTAAELQDKLTEHNPIDRLAPLAKAQVPIFHIHGDQDRVVPLKANSAELAKRYKSLGGPVEIEVIEGQGHNLWQGWFRSEKLTDFVIEQALGLPPTARPPVDTGMTKDLVTPVMTNKAPAAGKRVRQVAPEYKGTDVYHALYLPVDWKPDGKYPVIVEYTGNRFPPGNGSGEVKDANLGYGMSGGRGFIWVVMPYVEEGRKENARQMVGRQTGHGGLLQGQLAPHLQRIRRRHRQRVRLRLFPRRHWCELHWPCG